MKRQTNIFSIFGQIESVVADAMVAEGKANKIAFEDIPPIAASQSSGRERNAGRRSQRRPTMRFASGHSQ